MSFLIKRPDELARMRLEGSDSRLFKGGGGSSKPSAAEDRLSNATAAGLERLQGIAMPKLESSMDNLGSLANEADDGTLMGRSMGYVDSYGSSLGSGLAAYGDSLQGIYDNYGNQMRSEAAANTAGAIANQKAQRMRASAAMGINPNSGRFAGMERSAGINNAAMMAGAQNAVSKDLAEKQAAMKFDLAGRALSNNDSIANLRFGAQNAVEDARWSRNAGIAGLASGQGQSANAGMGQLYNTMSNNRNAANASDAQSAAGWGQMAMYGLNKSGVFGAADGGEIHHDGVHLADGGGLKRFSKTPQIQFTPFASGGGGREHGNEMTDMVGGMSSMYAMQAGPAMAKQIASRAMNSMGLGAPVGATSAATGAAGDAVAAGLAKDAALQGVTQGAGMSSAAGTGATMATEATAAAAGAAEAGTAAAGAGAAGSGALSAIGTAMPYVGVGLGVNALLGDPLGLEKLFADGGNVPKEGLKRKDFRKKGGKVSGPGTPTSDSIPAWLSDGEFVVNATAMKDPKIAKTVKKANKKGLERRYGKGA